MYFFTEKVKQHFENVLTGEVRQPISDGAKAAYWIYCNFLNKINSATESVGKDGKFQIFVCVGIRWVSCFGGHDLLHMMSPCRYKSCYITRGFVVFSISKLVISENKKI